MTPTAWSVLVGLLAIAVTVLLFFVGRLLTKLDARDTEIKVLSTAVTDLKISNAELRSTLRGALPAVAAQPEGHGG
jgi:hypothetical protein